MLVVKILFEFGYANLSEVEDAGSQCCIGLSQCEGIAEMFFGSGTARCDDRHLYSTAYRVKHLKIKSALNTVCIY